MEAAMAAPSDMSDPASAGSADSTEDTDMSQGFVIEIKVMPDGTFSVSQEPLEAEMEEEGNEGGAPATAGGEPPEAPEGPGDSDENEMPAKSFGDALKIALQMYQQSSSAQPNDQMQQGYSQG